MHTEIITLNQNLVSNYYCSPIIRHLSFITKTSVYFSFWNFKFLKEKVNRVCLNFYG